MLRLIVSIIFCLYFIVEINAQLYAPDKDADRNVEYTSEYHTDSIFIFNRPQPGEFITTSLIALPENDPCHWDYEWAVYNNGYTILKSDTGASSSLTGISAPGYYRVKMISDCEDTSIYSAWVLFNDFTVNIDKEPDSVHVAKKDYTCDNLWLKSHFNADTLHYSKPETDSVFQLYGGIEIIQWKTSADSVPVPGASLMPNLASPPSSPPAFDAWYTLEVTDRFGLTRQDSVFYESIETKVYVAAIPIHLDDTSYYDSPKNYDQYYYGEEYNKNDEYLHSAPLAVDLRNNSLNGSYYEWDFGDGSDSVTFSDSVKLIHVYYTPRANSYYLKLRSVSEEDCSHLDSIEIKVSASSITIEQNPDSSNSSIPNCFFAVEGNYFRFYDASIYNIKVRIFNRYGKIVHSYDGYVRDWPGWDFKVHGDRLASEGVYYYVIEAQKYNTESESYTSNKKKPYSGYFYLFHGK